MAISFDIKVNFDTNKYMKKFDIAQNVFTKMIKEDTTQYVPARDTLFLTNSAYIRNKTELVYRGPYAHFQYLGVVRVDENDRVWVGKGEKKPYIRDHKTMLIYTTSKHKKATMAWFEVSKKVNKERWIKKVGETFKNGNKNISVS